MQAVVAVRKALEVAFMQSLNARHCCIQGCQGIQWADKISDFCGQSAHGTLLLLLLLLLYLFDLQSLQCTGDCQTVNEMNMVVHSRFLKQQKCYREYSPDLTRLNNRFLKNTGS